MNETRIRLTWSQTGDFFDIQAADNDFAIWFLQQFDQKSTGFGIEKAPTDVSLLADKLTQNLNTVNLFLHQLKLPLLPVPQDLFDQKNLNLIHKCWINLVRKEPKLDHLFYFKERALFRQFHEVNQLTHMIENSFVYRLLGQPHTRLKNIFTGQSSPNGFYHVSIRYTDWGKSSWHKFLDNSVEPNDFELSNWKDIGSSLEINLRSKSYQINHSPDYLEYCSKHDIEPTVDYWPLGNLIDFEDTWAQVRTTMHKNSGISGNQLLLSAI
jgi:hypothetical protein